MNKTSTYISPKTEVCYLESEGVLCASQENNSTQLFDELPYYSPSEGEW